MRVSSARRGLVRPIFCPWQLHGGVRWINQTAIFIKPATLNIFSSALVFRLYQQLMTAGYVGDVADNHAFESADCIPYGFA